jgi:hypothetical protein
MPSHRTGSSNQQGIARELIVWAGSLGSVCFEVMGAVSRMVPPKRFIDACERLGDRIVSPRAAFRDCFTDVVRFPTLGEKLSVSA